MDIVEELLNKRKWAKRCLRANVAQPEDIVVYGNIKVAVIYSNVLNKRERERERESANQNYTMLSEKQPPSGGEKIPKKHYTKI